MEKYDTAEYKGYNIDIYYDTDPDNPRDWDNLGTIYTRHRHFQPENSFDDWFNEEEVFDDDLGKLFRDSFLEEYVALPIYLYEHGGATISTTPFSDRWDSGMVGIIAVPMSDARKQYEGTDEEVREKAEKQLQAEIDTFDQYVRGEVYGFRVTTPPERRFELPEVDESCWGFYGDGGLESLMEYAKNAIDYRLENSEKYMPKPVCVKIVMTPEQYKKCVEGENLKGVIARSSKSVNSDVPEFNFVGA
jgi:hypothetical protein